ncbi:hypothetical protein [Duganella sp. BJB476]|uniref:hypothetical protein n=1 Tax=Duganella sp. BJB476 TaxID=1871176 RepID=UPI000E35318C|nr:hypothetical protein [Duganella sp. BJB476]RFP32435.1 hypothetical protein D0T21_09545 [Duganella sp. BJB476]
MAGDWLKFEANTPEKREVFGIAVALGWPDPDLVVGKLLKIWRWFDQQTVDGNAQSVTLALLDNVCGVSGFAKAMCDVGWLVQNDGGVSLPNFGWHNGKTAKARCQTAKRVSSHKTNAKGNAKTNADSVTPALPREEKRREDKDTKTSSGISPAEAAIVVPPGATDTTPTHRWTPDDEKCARWLFSRVLANNAAARAPNFDNWSDDVRLLRERDMRTHTQICELFQWAQSDSFWCSNVLSPAKLRDKWDQLTMKRGSPPKGQHHGNFGKQDYSKGVGPDGQF